MGEPSVTLPTVVTFDQGRRRVSLQVTPLSNDGGKASQALVFFMDGGIVVESDETEQASDARPGEVRRVYAELRVSQEALLMSRNGHDALVQELRAAN